MEKLEEKAETATDIEVETETPSEQTKIRWDGSKMVSTYANVCNVSSTREEMTLLFGTNQSWHAGQKELTVELTNRTVMNPYAAKRLAILLGNTIREYEAQFGELKLNIGDNEGEKNS